MAVPESNNETSMPPMMEQMSSMMKQMSIIADEINLLLDETGCLTYQDAKKCISDAFLKLELPFSEIHVELFF